MKIHSARRNTFSCQGVYSIHEATLGYFRSDPVVSCLLHGLIFYMQLTLQVLIKFTRYWIDIGPEPRSAPRLENCCELLLNCVSEGFMDAFQLHYLNAICQCCVWTLTVRECLLFFSCNDPPSPSGNRKPPCPGFIRGTASLGKNLQAGDNLTPSHLPQVYLT